MTDSRSATPKGVSVKHGRYYRTRWVDGKLRWIALTRVDEGLIALRQALMELEQPFAVRKPRTIDELLTLYLPSAELAPATRREYERIATTRLAHHFGSMAIGALTQRHIAMFLEKRKRDGHNHMGNRERAVLSAAYEYALRNGWAETNPCRGVRRNRETPRRRYVTDAEFLAAFERAPEPLQDVMALALLTGLRQADLRALRREDLTSEGIRVVQSKTGKRTLVQWSDPVRFFVRRALERQQAIADRPADARRHRQTRAVSGCVLTNKFGEPWTMAGLQTAFKRLQVDWHFHDLRAKAASDASHNILGHGAGMLGVYVRAQTVQALR